MLGHFFEALHRPAPEDAPRNLVRGVPLVNRAAIFRRRVQSLAAREEWLDHRLLEIWETALAEPIDIGPTWIHGDPHPRNILVTGDRIAAAWMLFSDRQARMQAMIACSTVSAATWRRARGWAVFYGVMLLEAGLVDDPWMVAIARRTFDHVIAGPEGVIDRKVLAGLSRS